MRWPIKNIKNPQLQAQITHIGPGLVRPKASPDELLGELFSDVQLKRVHPDGMTFVDQVPAARLRHILKAYEVQRDRPGFDLHAFVARYFNDYLNEESQSYRSNPNNTVEEHINELWDVLTRTAYANNGSLIALPYPYVVPGGRFGAQFYWDTYFTMLGLAVSDRFDLIEGMLKNYAFMIRKIGHIPNGNRTYLLSRSHPPFFSHMVRLLAGKQGKLALVRYLPYVLSEYNFWMKGTKELSEEVRATRRVVLTPDGSILNRYGDSKRTPRPESYKEDLETAALADDRVPSQVYLDLRAGAESGWDFSSRWLRDGKNLHTIHTSELAPVDLNCLLVEIERTLADAYLILKQHKLAAKFQARADERIAAINRYCWSDDEGFYYDYDFMLDDVTYRKTAAALFPLYCQVATRKQAAAVVDVLQQDLLKDGGILTTLDYSGQQWDAPNGWAPLHWVAVRGLRNYGYHQLAEEVKKRWIATNMMTYEKSGKLVEKYNVVDPGGPSAGGGEYPLQDGFGWTNAVLLALLHEEKVDPLL